MGIYRRRGIHLAGALFLSLAVATTPSLAWETKVGVDRVDLREDSKNKDDKEKNRDKKPPKPHKKCPSKPCPNDHHHEGEDRD